jgi:hypothetical protein
MHRVLQSPAKPTTTSLLSAMAKDKYLHIRCEMWVLDMLKRIAKKQNRSRSNLILQILYEYIGRHWTDDLEESMRLYPGFDLDEAIRQHEATPVGRQAKAAGIRGTFVPREIVQASAYSASANSAPWVMNDSPPITPPIPRDVALPSPKRNKRKK